MITALAVGVITAVLVVLRVICVITVYDISAAVADKIIVFVAVCAQVAVCRIVRPYPVAAAPAGHRCPFSTFRAQDNIMNIHRLLFFNHAPALTACNFRFH